MVVAKFVIQCYTTNAEQMLVQINNNGISYLEFPLILHGVMLLIKIKVYFTIHIQIL